MTSLCNFMARLGTQTSPRKSGAIPDSAIPLASFATRWQSTTHLSWPHFGVQRSKFNAKRGDRRLRHDRGQHHRVGRPARVADGEPQAAPRALCTSCSSSSSGQLCCKSLCTIASSAFSAAHSAASRSSKAGRHHCGACRQTHPRTLLAR